MAEMLTLTATGFSVVFALLFLANYFGFRRSPLVDQTSNDLPAVSVLIPARNEAAGIEKTLQAILANDGLTFEVIVLDDQSDDGTAQIVERIAETENRLRLVRGQPLPTGWCGKQFACHQLAKAAQHNELLFLDADVALQPDAIRRTVALRQSSGVPLLSGFPRQIVRTLGEGLLIPLIHVVLLTYLPFILMRRTKMQSASAGCGQLFLTNREQYDQVGGHGAVRSSLHDGVTLPRAFRACGLSTDVFDAADIATCRMYHGWSQTWNGLSKNAHEGIANARLIAPFTFMMTLGFILPLLLMVFWLQQRNGYWTAVSSIAVLAAYVPRLFTAARFDRAWLAAILLPLSIVLFLTVQWTAFVRRWFGSQSLWRGRVYPVTST